jgi:hypothetical protein
MWGEVTFAVVLNMTDEATVRDNIDQYRQAIADAVEGVTVEQVHIKITMAATGAAGAAGAAGAGGAAGAAGAAARRLSESRTEEAEGGLVLLVTIDAASTSRAGAIEDVVGSAGFEEALAAELQEEGISSAGLAVDKSTLASTAAAASPSAEATAAAADTPGTRAGAGNGSVVAGAAGGALLLLAAVVLTVMRRRRIVNTKQEKECANDDPATEGEWKSRGRGATGEHVVGVAGGGGPLGGGPLGGGPLGGGPLGGGPLGGGPLGGGPLGGGPLGGGPLGGGGGRRNTIGEGDVEGLHEAGDMDMVHDSTRPVGRSDSVVEHKDENGRVYYYNKYNAKTGWTAEEASRGVAGLQGPRRPQGGGGDAMKPTGSVVKMVDESTGKAYYYNQRTNTTSWTADGASRGATNSEYGLEDASRGLEGAREAKAGEEAMDMKNPMFGHGSLSQHSSKLRMA